MIEELSKGIERSRAHLRKTAPSVLFADDDAEMRRYVQKGLRGFGYRVFECEDAAVFLRRVQAAILEQRAVDLPDVIVSDLCMPAIDGLELLEQLKGLGLEIPVIIVTAFGDPATRARARQRGAAYVFDKPFHLDDLLTVIVHLTAARRER